MKLEHLRKISKEERDNVSDRDLAITLRQEREKEVAKQKKQAARDKTDRHGAVASAALHRGTHERLQVDSRVKKVIIALGREFSEIDKVVAQAAREVRKEENKLQKQHIAESRGLKSDPVKQKELNEAVARQREATMDAASWPCKDDTTRKLCQHVGCRPLGDLVSSDLEEHRRVETAGRIQESREFFGASVHYLHRYAAECWGLTSAEIDVVMLDACAEKIFSDKDDLDTFVDRAVSTFGSRTGTTFVKAAVVGATLSTSPATEYNVLHALKTIVFDHFVAKDRAQQIGSERAFDSLPDNMQFRRLANSDQCGREEQEDAASLVESMVLICDRRSAVEPSVGPQSKLSSVDPQSKVFAESERCRRTINALDPMRWNLLEVVLRVPLWSREHTLRGRGSGVFVSRGENQVSEASLTPAILKSSETGSFVAFAIRKKNARLLQTLCEFGGGDALVLADLWASVGGMLETVLGAYPRPNEAIHAIMNIPMLKLSDSSALKFAQSDQFPG